MTSGSRLVIAAVVGALVLAGGLTYFIARAAGFSTRTAPTAFERVVVRTIHRLSVPARARDAANPIAFSTDVWAESRAHFADHCASCHANDGSGDTAIGRNLFPRAPDMRLAATQGKTDGELYWIIENGIRLTGMPAWGNGGADDADTWKLVHFVRHLKELTPDQLKAMAAANPRSPSELQEEQDDAKFLAGENLTPAPEPHHHQ
ncbi:MAG TPA: cytochrome c [Vicinamibacterales bacterium]|nr:cytochrome c [Vicinamibacterales bacterium]